MPKKSRQKAKLSQQEGAVFYFKPTCGACLRKVASICLKCVETGRFSESSDTYHEIESSVKTKQNQIQSLNTQTREIFNSHGLNYTDQKDFNDKINRLVRIYRTRKKIEAKLNETVEQNARCGNMLNQLDAHLADIKKKKIDLQQHAVRLSREVNKFDTVTRELSMNINILRLNAIYQLLARYFDLTIITRSTECNKILNVPLEMVQSSKTIGPEPTLNSRCAMLFAVLITLTIAKVLNTWVPASLLNNLEIKYLCSTDLPGRDYINQVYNSNYLLLHLIRSRLGHWNLRSSNNLINDLSSILVNIGSSPLTRPFDAHYRLELEGIYTSNDQSKDSNLSWEIVELDDIMEEPF